jgi:hypothetical protein
MAFVNRNRRKHTFLHNLKRANICQHKFIIVLCSCGQSMFVSCVRHEFNETARGNRQLLLNMENILQFSSLWHAFHAAQGCAAKCRRRT